MARQVRIEYPGAVYHVMARGDRREDIYYEETDRELFYETLKEAQQKFGAVVHGYVLMSNHYHLLLETPRGNLVATMKWFQNTYTRRMNVKHRLWGHLFGGRYKAIVVDDQESDYFARILDYIHLNPARIGWRSKGLSWSDYPYSSLRHYLGLKRPEWLEVKKGFFVHNLDDSKKGRQEFLQRLEERVKEEGMKKAGQALPDGQSLQSTLSRGWQFGTEAFRGKMLALMEKPLKKMRAKGQDGYRGQQMRDYGEEMAQRLVATAGKALGIEPDKWHRLKKGDWRKRLAAHLVQERTGMSLEWICRKLKMGDRSYACRGIAQIKKQLEVDAAKLKVKKQILMSINND